MVIPLKMADICVKKADFELNPIGRYAIRIEKAAACVHLPDINGRRYTYNTHTVSRRLRATKFYQSSRPVKLNI
jgi:hypothetical protein